MSDSTADLDQEKHLDILNCSFYTCDLIELKPKNIPLQDPQKALSLSLNLL